MTNGRIPPEWVKMNSKTRPYSYFFNTSDGKAYWDKDIHFGEDGKVTISPSAKQINDSSQKSTNVIDKDLDDEFMAKLYNSKPLNPVQNNQAKIMNNNLKRKIEGNVSQNEDLRHNHSIKNGVTQPVYPRKVLEAPCKIKKPNNNEEQQINVGTVEKPSEYSTDSGISLSLSKEDYTPKQDTNKHCNKKEEPKSRPQKSLNKTPKQEKFNQIKGSLLKKQQEETHRKSQSNLCHKELKRKSSDDQAHPQRDSLESAESHRKKMTFGYPQRHSLESAEPTRRAVTSAHPQRYSLESAEPHRKKITFDYPQRHSLQSVEPTRRAVTSDSRQSDHSDSPELETSNWKRVPIDIKESHSLPSTSSDSPVHEKQIFDLRTKLQQRKSYSTFNNLQPDVPCPMDWETSYPVAQISQEANTVKVVNNQSPPSQERHPNFSNVYLVCDTSALLNDCAFVESLINKGSHLGLPLKVVIPAVVFDELDKLKNNSQVAYQARQISRIIQSSHTDKHIILQDGDKKREAVGSLVFKNNDDLVLNCCLQYRGKCIENELAVLITTDIGLSNKGASFKLQTYNWQSFKRWARGFREYKTPSFLPHTSKQVSPRKMSVDEDTCEDRVEKIDQNTTESEAMILDRSISNRIQKPDSISNQARKIQLQNIIQSHVEELKTDFQMFLHNVLEEAYEKEYGKSLKKFASNIKPSWTVLDYICELKKRWFLLTRSTHSPEVQHILQELLLIFKRHNSGKDELKVAEVDNQFHLCESLTNIIVQHSPEQANRFLETLSVSKEDWKKANNASSPTNYVENDVQPVDVALQNIYQCSFSDYEALKKQFDSNSHDQQNTGKQLQMFFGRIADVELVMKKIFEEEPGALTITNKYILQLHKVVTFFSDVKGNPIGFEIVVENVVELFQDKMYRNNAEQLIEKFDNLKVLIDGLICSHED